MTWIEHTIWWHVYPLGFAGADTTGADRSPGDGLRRLIPWLDHVIELGANGLALGPVFASSTHGYDTIDWFRVDPRLGGEEDLVALIDAAHEKGVRVMLDGVFNHVGPEFPAVLAARRDPGSAGARMLRRTPDGALDTFEGHGGLIALDHEQPEVARTVAEAMTYWADRGADAWRLDAAYAVPPAFWTRVLPTVRARHPDVWVVGEVLHGDYADIVARSGIDSVTQYELWQGIWHGIDDGNMHELAWALQRHNGFLDAFVPMTFVGNHDVTRIATQIRDARHRSHAIALLFALGGVPSVYYGDEYGLEAVKEERFGGDDAIRPAFPASPDHPVEAARPDVYALHRALIGVRRRHPWLHRARTRTVAVTNETLVLDVVPAPSEPDAEKLTMLLNLGDAELRFAPGGTPRYLAGHAAGTDGADLVAGPHGWLIAARP